MDAKYLSGEQLYGDNSGPAELAQWYADEENAYANLGAEDLDSYEYKYHELNRLLGFRHLPDRRFRNVLGIGSAYGFEFKPIKQRIGHLTILDSADAFKTTELEDIDLTYVKPDPSGTMPFQNDLFDLTLALSVLHHIANVSHVIKEIYRTLRPGGYALLREPIISMGDWTKARGKGLTPHERGLPLPWVRRVITSEGFTVVAECLYGFRPLAILWNRMGSSLYNSPLGVRLDKALVRCFAWNWTYHATSSWRKLRPTAVYMVLRKPE